MNKFSINKSPLNKPKLINDLNEDLDDNIYSEHILTKNFIQEFQYLSTLSNKKLLEEEEKDQPSPRFNDSSMNLRDKKIDGKAEPQSLFLNRKKEPTLDCIEKFWNLE